MSGVIVGLEFAEVMTTAKDLCGGDPALLTECLISLEIGALEGIAKTLPKS